MHRWIYKWLFYVSNKLKFIVYSKEAWCICKQSTNQCERGEGKMAWWCQKNKASEKRAEIKTSEGRGESLHVSQILTRHTLNAVQLQCISTYLYPPMLGEERWQKDEDRGMSKGNGRQKRRWDQKENCFDDTHDGIWERKKEDTQNNESLFFFCQRTHRLNGCVHGHMVKGGLCP